MRPDRPTISAVIPTLDEEANLAGDIRVKRIDALRLAQASSWTNALLTVEGRDDTELQLRLDELLAGLGQSKLELLFEQEIRALGTSCVVPLLRFIASPRSFGDPEKRLPGPLRGGLCSAVHRAGGGRCSCHVMVPINATLKPNQGHLEKKPAAR